MPRLIEINKKYGNNTVFDGFCAEFEEKKTTVILGESGVGKTTLLNVVANLTDHEGTVEGFGKISYVFQSPRLIPWLTVYENLEYVLFSVEKDTTARKNMIETALETVRLSPLKNRLAEKLSGGEAQRVALARAFLYPCDTILLDEAFNSLDLSLKTGLLSDFRDLSKAYGKTCVFVTHDVNEALFIADRIFILEENSLVDFGAVSGERAYGYEADGSLRRKLYDYLLR
ncbi:MAG: ABC transporter ATP-binding protein [Clostridia bacterium]|nr:ABC transporter ATP-binding protein [Clostridia bacterium]